MNIFYNSRRRRYEVAGRTYSPEGKELTDFKSTYVLFPSKKDAKIEFIWLREQFIARLHPDDA